MEVSERLLRVFVVDDENVIASSLAMVLRFQGGFHATSFDQPEAALQAARSDAPDLLIFDVWMPQLSGIELAIQLQYFCPACKVLLFTGQTAAGPLIDSARASGYNFELLSKPVHPANLLAKIRDLTQTVPPLPIHEDHRSISIYGGPGCQASPAFERRQFRLTYPMIKTA